MLVVWYLHRIILFEPVAVQPVAGFSFPTPRYSNVFLFFPDNDTFAGSRIGDFIQIHAERTTQFNKQFRILAIVVPFV
jgi:hypothetical protein